MEGPLKSKCFRRNSVFKYFVTFYFYDFCFITDGNFIKTVISPYNKCMFPSEKLQCFSIKSMYRFVIKSHKLVFQLSVWMKKRSEHVKHSSYSKSLSHFPHFSYKLMEERCMEKCKVAVFKFIQLCNK